MLCLALALVTVLFSLLCVKRIMTWSLYRTVIAQHRRSPNSLSANLQKAAATKLHLSIGAATMATLAAFKPPAVRNEVNVSCDSLPKAVLRIGLGQLT